MRDLNSSDVEKWAEVLTNSGEIPKHLIVI